MKLTKRTPWHVWVVGIVTLLWNAVGVSSYLATRLGKLKELGLTEAHVAYFDSYPVWANATWALGVWFSLAASILILLRSKWAYTVMLISMIGLIGTSIYQHILSTTPPELSNPPIPIAVWVISLFTLWYTHNMRAKGVLR